MQDKDFVVGKRPNYYTISSKAQHHDEGRNNKPGTCDTEKRSSQKTVKPKSYWKLKKPIEIGNNSQDKLWENNRKSKRFNEQTINYNETLSYPKIKGSKKLKEKEIATEIIKGLETLNEEGLVGMLTYMRFIQEEQGSSETTNNLNKLQVNDVSIRKEDLKIKSYTPAKTPDNNTFKVSNA